MAVMQVSKTDFAVETMFAQCHIFTFGLLTIKQMELSKVFKYAVFKPRGGDRNIAVGVASAEART
ncbi:MAG: hypothetical protein J6X49_19865 [Victivallales bacterium]|nr:hypothetical protein [Victivallales bacterium]